MVSRQPNQEMSQSSRGSYFNIFEATNAINAKMKIQQLNFKSFFKGLFGSKEWRDFKGGF